MNRLCIPVNRYWRSLAFPREQAKVGIWSAARCLLYARASVLVALILFAGILGHSTLVSAEGYTPLFDFAVFWAAASLTLQGHPERAYDVHQLHLVLQQVLHFSVAEGGYGWFYPPFVLLLFSPLARLAPFHSDLLFMGVTLSIYLLVIHRVIRRLGSVPSLWWGVLGFSGLWYNLILGQNGFVTAALGAAMLLTLERHPYKSGIFLGLLLLKPQLGLLLPLLLVYQRAWRALFSAALTVALTFAGAWALLGTPSLQAWWHNMDLARVFLERGGDNYLFKIPSVYAGMTLLGTSHPVAYLAQGITALMVVLVVTRIWHLNADWRLRYAAALLGGLLMSPYVFEYDLTALIFPLLWLLDYGRERGWYPAERSVLALLWLLPYVMTLVEPHIHLQLAPLLLWLQLLLIWRRAHTDGPKPRANT